MARSVINYFSKGGEPDVYWVNTSNNDLAKEILARGSGPFKSAFELLIQGEEVVREIDEYITLPRLFHNEEIAWSLLLFSGYLKVVKKVRVAAHYQCTLQIPNQEVLGLLVSLQETHVVKSNKESGYGRYDVLIIPKDHSKLGTIIEFKVVDKKSEIAQGVEKAFKQIEDQQYRIELESLGISQIQTLAIVFCGKQMKLVAR